MGLGGPEPYLRSHTLGFGDLPMLHEIIGIRRCDYEDPPSSTAWHPHQLTRSRPVNGKQVLRHLFADDMPLPEQSGNALDEFFSFA